ncbi:MAG TPA: efflux RND transporter periplasmic adaptor subunit [Devosia sp.]|nr:efflux RND transporter periplasmic adaptor subunit [Devosia sp.]
MRAIYSYGIAGLIILVIAAWLATGTFVAGGKGPGNGERAIIDIGGEHHAASDHPGENVDPHLTIAERVAQAGGAEAEARSVRTQTFTMQPLTVEAPLRGKTKAKSVISVMPETAGVVQAVHVQKGQRVSVGDLLCTLESGTRQAAVDQAAAGLAQAQQDFDTNKSLRDKGIAAANTAKGVEAALKGAQSAFDNATLELSRTEVRAKVAGVVQDPLAMPGSAIGPQAACATIVELDPMLFVGAIPEARIGLAKTGLAASITTITGQTSEGTVSYISSIADPATRSFPVEIEVANGNGALRDGLTATATVNLGTAPAHLLPQSVLTLDDAGTLGVRTVEDGVVAFYPVTILKDTREGIWVSGLPAKADVITVGQEFVQPGQKVNATNVVASPETATAAKGA